MSATLRKANKFEVVRFIRPTLAILLIGVVLFIILYLVLHIKHWPAPQPRDKEVVGQKIDVKEKVKYFEFKGEKGKVEIKYDRSYIGSDNLYHLEGHVEIVDYGKKGGPEIHFTALEAAYDKDWTQVFLRGDARIQSKGLTVASEVFNYDKTQEILKTEAGLTITSSRFSGVAKKGSYSFKEEELILENDLEFKITPKLGNPEPLTIWAKRLRYHLGQRRGAVENGVEFSRGESHGTADTVEFELFSDDDNLRTLWLRGNVQVHLREKNKQAVAQEKTGKASPAVPQAELQTDHSLFFFDTDTQDIKADHIYLRAYKNAPQLRFVEARGYCSFYLLAETGNVNRIEGETVIFFFTRKGRFRELRVTGRGRMTAFSKELPSGRQIDADYISLDGINRVLRIGGTADRPARSVSSYREVTGRSLVFFFQNNNFDAWGGVRIILERQKQSQETPGFFSGENPVFCSAQLVRYSELAKRLMFSGQVKMWQEKKVLQAESISISEDTQNMSAEKDIKFVFSQILKEGGKEERLEIMADKMDYDPRANLISYAGRCSLKTRNIYLQSRTVSVMPDAATGKIRQIRALGNITILQGTKEAVGEAAEYDVEKEIMVLTGHPVMTEKNKGTVRGDKLTFHLADGRILVENRDQERSVTVIKS